MTQNIQHFAEHKNVNGSFYVIITLGDLNEIINLLP